MSESQMLAADVARDAINRAMASPRVLNLARLLQIAALPERKDLVGAFRPKPVYLQQATALLASDDYRGFALELLAR